MRRVVAVGAMVLMLASVGFADTKMDYDHSVNFYKYKTYAWKELPVGDDIVSNSLVLKRIRDAVDETLPFKGLRRVNSNPDLYLTARVAAQQLENFYYYPTAGYGYWGATDVVVNYYVEGTIILDMIDARTNR